MWDISWIHMKNKPVYWTVLDLFMKEEETREAKFVRGLAYIDCSYVGNLQLPTHYYFSEH